MTLGSKIRTLRSLRNLTQENMSVLLNISTNAYGKIERAQTNPSHLRLEEIASIFGVSVVELVSFGNNNQQYFLEKKQNKSVGSILDSNLSIMEFNKMKHKIDKLELELSRVKEIVKLIKTK